MTIRGGVNVLLQPPHRRDGKPHTPAPRRKPRRLNSKVTVSYVEPRPAEQATPHPIITPELLLAYKREGLDKHVDAVRLFRAGVAPSEIGDWTGVGVGKEDYARMARLHEGGVKPSHLSDYPKMHDYELIAFLRAEISADTVHAFGHQMELCCGYQPPPPVLPANLRPLRSLPSFLPSGKWGFVIEWSRMGVNPAQVGELYRRLHSNCADVNMMLGYHASIKLLDYVRPDQVRVEWRKWVAAADGHVNVAKAVCDAGWSIDTVRVWLETGETTERIILLARAGVNPYVLDKHPIAAELTEEDLEIWALLNEMSS